MSVFVGLGGDNILRKTNWHIGQVNPFCPRDFRMTSKIVRQREITKGDFGWSTKERVKDIW